MVFMKSKLSYKEASVKIDVLKDVQPNSINT